MIFQLPLICFIKCLSLNNAVAVSSVLSDSYMETRLMIVFDFQLCETWHQSSTEVPPKPMLLLGNCEGSSLHQLSYKHKDSISSTRCVFN